MTAVPAPVSWLLIRPGWKVYAADGSQVGEVDETAGDETRDIFDGIVLATSALGAPRYVLAEQVAEIREGVVRLSLTVAEVEALEEYQEPATSAQIEADSKGGLANQLSSDAREIEGKLVHPVQRHAHPMNIWRRMYLALRRLIRR